MLVVVFQHIRAFGFGLMANDGVLSIVYLTFMLPSFFLVSGFTSYRTDIKNPQLSTLLDRFRQLIVPTVVFLLIHNLLGYDRWGFPGGYWFTYALFLIIVLNYVIQKLFPDKWYILALIITSVIFFGQRIYFGSLLDSGWPRYLSLHHVFTFFQYYALGVILKKYYDGVKVLISKNIFRNITIIIVAIGFLLSSKLSCILPSASYSAYNNALDFISTFTVFMLFYFFRSTFETDSLAARFLKYVGRRTLDLYMLHYFFIPSLMIFGYWFNSTGNSCLELFIVGLLTIMVTIMSLFISNVLKASTIIDYWLLGGRKQKMKVLQ